MVIEPGSRLLHYRLVEQIGKGGMGVVWRAVDTSLDREVAIKLLPDDFAADPERLARFEREARLLATLNHPNIAAIYGLHEAPADSQDGRRIRFIAMELIEGDTLADRISSSGLSVEETLEVARQVAEALEVAHDRGIVHRDLKPANVKVRPDGTVKVLDFGLAREMTGDPRGDSESEVPTATAETRPGAVLGTAPYMSPEQARGKPVDKRTDIWALGCLLFECLSGRRAFGGDSTPDVLARIASEQPDFASLPSVTPRFLERLMRRCLDKNTRRRLRDAGELRIAVETFQSDPESQDLEAPVVPSRPVSARRSILPWGLAVALGFLLVYVSITQRNDRSHEGPGVSRWSIALPLGSRVGLPSPGGGFDYSRTVAISRDGSRIGFSAESAEDQADLFVKSGPHDVKKIPGTTNGRAPFFSPDGEWLGFYDSDFNALYKVPLSGGSPQKLADLERTISFDAAWAPDGRTIVCATDDGLWRLPAEGGTPEQLTRPAGDQGEIGHHSPRFTADGKSILFTVSAVEETHVALLNLETGSWKTIVPDASLGLPIDGDRIVVARAGELLIAPYDPGDHRISGSLISVVQDVATTPGMGGIVLTQFDVSDNGTLVYAPAPRIQPPEQLLWVDKNGNETLIVEGDGTWIHPRLSPDGKRISIDIHAPTGMRDIHIYELERGQFRQLTRTGMTWESEWSPDGERLAILSADPAGQWSLFWVRTDFSGPPELLHHSSHAIPASWLPGGKSLLFSEWVEGGIWQLTPGEDHEPILVLDTSAREGFPRISPDGQWIAFVETESGRREIFVQAFPVAGPKYKISIEGGGEPVWSNDGGKLFFSQPEKNQMFEVAVDYEPSIRFGPPRLLFTGDFDTARVGHQHYDISLDDRRFLMIRHGEPDGPSEVRVVLDWFEELNGR